MDALHAQARGAEEERGADNMVTTVTIDVSLDRLLRVRLHDQSVRGYLMEQLSQEVQKRGLVHRNEFDLQRFVDVRFSLRDGCIVVSAEVVAADASEGYDVAAVQRRAAVEVEAEKR